MGASILKEKKKEGNRITGLVWRRWLETGTELDGAVTAAITITAELQRSHLNATQEANFIWDEVSDELLWIIPYKYPQTSLTIPQDIMIDALSTSPGPRWIRYIGKDIFLLSFSLQCKASLWVFQFPSDALQVH